MHRICAKFPQQQSANSQIDFHMSTRVLSTCHNNFYQSFPSSLFIRFDRCSSEEMNRLLAECYEAACTSDSGFFFASFDEDNSLFAAPKENTGLKAGLRSLRPYVPYMPLKLPSDLDRRPSACPVIPEDSPTRRMSSADSPLRRQSTPCVDSSDPRRGPRRKLRLLSRDASREKSIAPDESSEAAMLPWEGYHAFCCKLQLVICLPCVSFARNRFVFYAFVFYRYVVFAFRWRGYVEGRRMNTWQLQNSKLLAR